MSPLQETKKYFSVQKFSPLYRKGSVSAILPAEREFMNVILTKDLSLLHYAIHSHFYWRILHSCMVFSDSSFLQQPEVWVRRMRTLTQISYASV
jgi:hypothetical protein